jgi:hypothetical protein
VEALTSRAGLLRHSRTGAPVSSRSRQRFRFASRFLLILAGAALPCTLRGAEEPAPTLMRQMVDFTGLALKDMDPARPGFVPRNDSHTHDPDPCYPMAFLYKTRHPLNPYYGDAKIRDTAVAICDRIAAAKMRPEWPLYLVCQVFDLLKDEIPANKREAWKAYAADYAATRARQPYFYTSPNHEAWNALAVFRAGQVFGEPRWSAMGRRLMHQLVKMQTRLGYFDEGPHHGPAMKYNQVQLAPMLLFADYAQDAAVLEASRKLADFMIRYSFPDGSPIGAFDGRQSYSPGYFGTLCYGLDRWPLGKELNRRIYQTRKKWNLLDVQSPYYSFSDWYAYFGSFFLVDEYRSLVPDAPAQPLPQDRDGYRMVEDDDSFSGGVVRRNDWMVALSAMRSDVPRYSGGPYQLERQSRLDIWHERTGLIVGGGSNMVGAEIPLANFLLLTGHKGVDADFGRLTGGEMRDRQAVYFPRSIRAELTSDAQTLEASFGHGDFHLTSRPASAKRLELEYEYDILAANKAFLQLPLILFYGSRVQVDGRDWDQLAPVPVKREIEIRNRTTATAVRVAVPQGVEMLLRRPIYPLRWYIGEHKDQRYWPYYQIALLSVSLRPAAGRGKGRFLFELGDAGSAPSSARVGPGLVRREYTSSQ